jgi:hypothetical protein
MRPSHFGAAALIFLFAGCGDFYSNNPGEALRSNAGFTRENPAPVGPPVSLRPAGAAQGSDVGANPSQGAPVAAP